jgi:hypothetical protein
MQGALDIQNLRQGHRTRLTSCVLDCECGVVRTTFECVSLEPARRPPSTGAPTPPVGTRRHPAKTKAARIWSGWLQRIEHRDGRATFTDRPPDGTGARQPPLQHEGRWWAGQERLGTACEARPSPPPPPSDAFLALRGQAPDAQTRPSRQDVIMVACINGTSCFDATGLAPFSRCLGTDLANDGSVALSGGNMDRAGNIDKPPTNVASCPA